MILFPAFNEFAVPLITTCICKNTLDEKEYDLFEKFAVCVDEFNTILANEVPTVDTFVE
jgi:hypothetical protein